MRRPALVASLALAFVSFARADDGKDCLAWNSGGSFAANVTSIGVTRAVRLDIGSNASPVNVVQARIFTGLITAPSQLGLRAHDAMQNAPGATLGQAPFTVKSVLGWQGAAFTVPVELTPGETYWLTWDAPVGAQMPWSPPKSYSGQPHRISYDGGQTWVSQVFQSNSSHFKIRLLGACGCGTSLQSYGQGCAGSGGYVPAVVAAVCPTIGQELTVSVGHGLGGAWSVVVFGDTTGQTPVFGTDCDLLVAPVRPPLLIQPLAGAGPGAGFYHLSGMIDASAKGMSFTMQAFVVDPGVARGFSGSPALRVAIP